jgi:hypothetical protein
MLKHLTEFTSFGRLNNILLNRQSRWLMPVILAPQKAEIKKINRFASRPALATSS